MGRRLGRGWLRSKLFVPAARPDLFAKALVGDADALSFDLEDAVPEDGKAAARERLAAFLAGDALRGSSKTVIVRVNAPDGPHFAADLAALANARVDLVNLPKIADPAALARAGDAVAAAASAGASRLLVNIETPAAVARAAAIAAAHPLVAGLQVGLNDLFATLGADRRRPEPVQAALWQLRLAAAEAGVFAYDGAWPDVADAAGFEAEARAARAIGFLGKSCIHPRQVAAANAIFDAAGSIDEARRIVRAAAVAARAGHGAFLLEGRMIDAPAIVRAKKLLAQAGEGA